MLFIDVRTYCVYVRTIVGLVGVELVLLVVVPVQLLVLLGVHLLMLLLLILLGIARLESNTIPNPTMIGLAMPRDRGRHNMNNNS